MNASLRCLVAALRLPVVSALVLLWLVPSSANAQSTVTYTPVYNLDYGLEGTDSRSGLVRGPDGMLYGTTNLGGPGDFGTLFSIHPVSHAVTVRFNFGFDLSDIDGGSYPVALRLSRFDGYLYGTTEYGGAYNAGTIFRYAVPGSSLGPGNWTAAPGGGWIETVYSLNCAAGESGDPYGLLTEGPDGALYGITAGHSQGLGCGDGMIYKLDRDTRVLTNLYSLQEPVTGRFMWGPLVVGSDGSLFGTTYDSGTGPTLGMVFRVPPAGNSIEFLHVFGGAGAPIANPPGCPAAPGPDGAYPGSGMVRGYDGAMYGLTEAGGLNNTGTIFRITEQGCHSTLYSFPEFQLDVNGDPIPEAGKLTPGHPAPPLLPDGSGRFIGVAFSGGEFAAGGVFEFIYDAQAGTGQFFVLHEFNDTADPPDGAAPYGIGLESSGGGTSYLFGATSWGGTIGDGTLFGLTVQPELQPFAPFAVATSSPANPVEATGPGGALVQISGANSSDVEGDPLTFEWSDLPDGPATATDVTLSRTFPITDAGPGTTVHLQVTDITLKSSNTFLTVVVRDTTPPGIGVTGPAPGFEALPTISTSEGLLPNVAITTSGASAVVDFASVVNFTVTDLVTTDGSLMPVMCNPTSGSAFPAGESTVVTCTATDERGNTGSVKFAVSVTSALPTMEDLPDITAEATTQSGAAVNFDVIAIDAGGSPLPPEAIECLSGEGVVQSGDVFPIDSTLVTCTATAGPGLAVTDDFTITVQDTTRPVMYTDGNLILPEQTPSGTFVDLSVSPTMPYATDLGVTLPVTCTDSVHGVFVPSELTAPLLYPIGTTSVTCEATDGASLTSTAMFTVRVNDDQPPVFEARDAEEKEATAAQTPVSFTVSVSDLEGSPFTTSCTPASGSNFPVGTTPVTCTATDTPPDTAGSGIGANHTSTFTFNVIVHDTTPPVLTVPVRVLAGATSPAGGNVSFAALVTAVDLVDGAIPASLITCTPASGSFFPLGISLVSCYAEDSRGNRSAPKTFEVKVALGPTLTLPAPITVNAVGLTGSTVSFLASAQNDEGVTYPVACTWGAPIRTVTFPAGSTTPLGGLFAIGINTVTCASSDEFNTSIGTFIVTVVDQPPVITVPADITMNATAMGTATVSFIASARDVVNGAVPVTCTWPGAPSVLTFPAVGAVQLSGVFTVGTTVVTCSASDLGSPVHTATATFNVTVTPPTPIGTFVAFSSDQTWLWARTRVVTGDVGANTQASRQGFGGHGWDDDRWNDGDHWGDKWGHHDNDGHSHHDGRHKVGAIEVRLGQGVVMAQPDSRVIGDTVWLQPHTSVYNVIVNDLIKQQGATVLGTLTTGLSLPLVNMPTVIPSNPGTLDIKVAKNKTLTLAPGRYRNITVQQNATLVLLGGLYEVQSLNLAERATVKVVSATEMRIRGELEAGARTSIIADPILGAALRASQIVFYVEGLDSDNRHRGSHRSDDDDDDDEGEQDDAGETVVRFGTRSTIYANIYAPNGTLWIQARAKATGAFLGKRVRIGTDSLLTLDSRF